MSRRPYVTDRSRIFKALNIIKRFGGIGGAHHKQWVLDQVVRALAKDYEAWLKAYKAGEDGANTYEWDKGITP